MTTGRLARVVGDELRRNWRHVTLAAVGIVVGIASLTFFLGLGAAVRDQVVGRVFPLDRLEVVKRPLDIDLWALRVGLSSDTLTEDLIDRLRGLSGVSAVYPKMKLLVPAVASGGASLLGSSFATELVADGIDPSLVAEDVGPGLRFDQPQLDLAAEGEEVTCQTDADCGSDAYCTARGPGAATCRPYIPVVASNYLVEIYNGSLRRAYGLPKLNPEAALGHSFSLRIGASMLRLGEPARATEERARLVGFSDKAIPLGLTMPIGIVRELNRRFVGARAAEEFHSAVLEVASPRDLDRVIRGVEALGLTVADRTAERAALLISIVMLVFGAISATIVVIAGLSIMHVFFMLGAQRQHEIGVMRGVGATRGDIRAVFLVEAAVIGLAAGAAGVGLAVATGQALDALARSRLPDFPFKPESFFQFDASLVLGVLLFAVVVCLLGAFLPAQRAARMDPARVLAGR